MATKADIAQLVEQLIRNQQVSGSTPLVGSSNFKGLQLVTGCNPFLYWGWEAGASMLSGS